ncbi:hypothetical protein JCM10450v2_000050 [Rhodotorula kratochvilovae]
MGTLAHARGAQATAPTTLGQAEGAAQAAHAGETSLPPPVAVDYALPDQAPSSAPSGDDREFSRPVTPARSGSSKDHTSPRKPTYHYKHHEPAPRRLLKRLNSLVHGGKPHRKHSHPSSSAASSRPGSVLSSLRPSHAPTPLSAEPAPLSPPPPPLAPAEATRPSIKIRLVTFNMHDSLPSPSGDLSEFLGDVSLFPEEHLPRKRPRGGSRSSRGSTVTVPLPDADEDGEALPSFPLTEGHPYHIVVVCGQECPTASGVLAGKVPRLDGKGWTSLLEAYLCGGCSHSSSPSESSASSNDGASDAEAGDEGASARAPSGGSCSRSRGPYVLVEKERLMGIYCAVFVARCCEGLVKGASTGRVTAGLMGGRMGNKGGVGISLHLHHTRLLFVSAHLAAHASGLEFRKANAAKILDELVVDDFWAQSGKEGPRPEKLVERFDAVFFAGDLNFRLNISRLHADWLVRGRDYTTALRFDQLRDVLASSASGGCFSGFAEGEIAFPPTYKYDVPARKKKRRGTLLRLAAGGGGGGGGGGKAIGGREGAATDPEVPLSSVPGTPRPAPAGGFGGGGGAWTPGATTATDDDALSIVSSIGTMSTLDADCADPLLDAPEAVAAREDLASLGLPPAPGKGGETGLDAVRKAQVRFLTLVKRNSNAAAMEYAKRAREASEGAGGAGAGGRGRRSTLSGLFPPRPILRSSQSAVVVPTTTISACTEEESDEGAEDTKTLDEAAAPASVSAVEPVFDSSKKQRVQSWTDRILFHSSAPPPSPPPAAPSPALAPPLLPVASPDGASSPPRRPASANEVRHPRFEPPSPSSDSLARSPSSPSLDEHPSLWRRVKSTVFDSPDAPEAAPAAPPRRPRPRKRFTLSGDSSSSSDEAEGLSRRTGPSVTPERRDLPHSASDSPAPSAPPNASASASGTGFPRARTFSAALNALHDRAPGALALGHAHTQSASSTSPSASGTSLNTRLRSFLSLLPLPPFLSTPARPAPLPAQEEVVKREPSGPRRGEVQVLKYDCVRDLARMGAVSDHRPVFLVCALGVGEEEERGAGGGG